MKYCVKCGESLPKEAKFCGSCGLKTNGSKERKNLTRSFLVAGAISILVIGVVVAFLFNKEPEAELTQAQIYQKEQLEKIESSKEFLEEFAERGETEEVAAPETDYESEEIISWEEINGYWHDPVADKFISFDFNRGAAGDFTIHDFEGLRVYTIQTSTKNGKKGYQVTQDGEPVPIEILLEDESTISLSENGKTSSYTRSSEEELFTSYVEYENAALGGDVDEQLQESSQAGQTNEGPSVNDHTPSVTYTTADGGTTLILEFHNLGSYKPAELEMIDSQSTEAAVINNDGTISPANPDDIMSAWQNVNGNVQYWYHNYQYGSDTEARVTLTAPEKDPISLSVFYKVP